MNNIARKTGNNPQKGIYIIVLTGFLIALATVILVVTVSSEEEIQKKTKRLSFPPSKKVEVKKEIQEPLVMDVFPEKTEPTGKVEKRRKRRSGDTGIRRERIKDVPAPEPDYKYHGYLDPKEAKKVINMHTSEVRSCYEKRLKVNSVLQGTIELAITIGTTGRVRRVSFSRDTVRDPAVVDCVKRKVMKWRFPEPEGGKVQIKTPFRFTPKS